MAVAVAVAVGSAGGLNPHRATTTAMVADVPLAQEEYVEAVRSSLQQQGGDPCACCSVDEADDLAALVADWPVGAVVERRLDELVVRELPGAGSRDRTGTR